MQNVLAEIRAENVVKTIVVVVPNADTGGPAGAEQSSLFGNISECAVAIVLVKLVCRSGRRAFEARPAEQENVHPSVVIEVDESAATPGRFQNVFLALHASINHWFAKPSVGSDIDKTCIERPPEGAGLASGFAVWVDTP